MRASREVRRTLHNRLRNQVLVSPPIFSFQLDYFRRLALSFLDGVYAGQRAWRLRNRNVGIISVRIETLLFKIEHYCLRSLVATLYCLCAPVLHALGATPLSIPLLGTCHVRLVWSNSCSPTQTAKAARSSKIE